jgi:hypothetical protein
MIYWEEIRFRHGIKFSETGYLCKAMSLTRQRVREGTV